MGKRSNFEKVEKDFYRTFDPRAIIPLIPFIKGLKYIEPCAGQLDLIGLLDSYAECVNYSDISNGTDALTIGIDYLKDADCIITNPPWSRDKKSGFILHKLILHFSKLKPTWLLFDSDWAFTKQSAEYMKYCTDIVPVGRLTWIEGTNQTGKDNCAWYRFDFNNSEKTIFHPRN